MRLGSKIQALLRRALTGDRQRQYGEIRPARRREREQFVVVDCMKRPAGHRGATPRGQGEESMNKGEMADRLAARAGLNKTAARVAVDDVFARIGEALANGEEVRIAGFGSFGTRSRAARTGRNPRTGETVSIPASKSPAFKAGKTLKDAVNAGQRP